MSIETSNLLKKDSFADLLCTIVVLTRGTHDGGKPCWAYVALKPSLALAYKDACARGNVELEDYGTILEYGDGVNPPLDIQEKMQRDFGVGGDFEQKLDHIIKQFH